MAAACVQAIWTQENTQNELAGSAETKAAAPKDEVEAALADRQRKAACRSYRPAERR